MTITENKRFLKELLERKQELEIRISKGDLGAQNSMENVFAQIKIVEAEIRSGQDYYTGNSLEA